MKLSIITRLLALLSFSVFLVSCESGILGLQNNGPVFNLDVFEQNIVDYVKANGQTPVGWAYTISVDGQLEKSFTEGQARTSADGAVDFTLNKEINVASVTKFYTAIAAMQLLEKNNLNIDTKIDDWLPDSWSQGPAINNLSFKDLLRHQSGLKSVNTDFDNTLTYEGLKDCIETGVVKLKSREYLNVNFALFRVLIPSLWSAVNPNLDIDLESDDNTQYWYLLYMQQYVFDVMNLPDVGCVPEDKSDCTLYYHINDGNSTKGDYYGNWNSWSGGGGYFMTIMELASVIAFFEHTEDLVSKEQRDIMKEHRFGMDTEDELDEDHGSYYGKGGSIGNNDDSSISQGVLTQMVMFPGNGVDCVVVMNCQGMTFKDNNSLRQTIYNAYNDAWE